MRRITMCLADFLTEWEMRNDKLAPDWIEYIRSKMVCKFVDGNNDPNGFLYYGIFNENPGLMLRIVKRIF